MVSKKELRKEILARRDALSEKERREKSTRISKGVTEQEEFQKANKVLLFASCKSEVDTMEIFDVARINNKDIYYPKVIGKEMEFYQIHSKEELLEGYRGIYEPESNPNKMFVPQLKDKIFVLMPGAVFDEDGNRIGYGGGYYDKYLQQLENIVPRENIWKTAIAFECQMVEKGKIPIEKYDIKPDYVITEGRGISI